MSSADGGPSWQTMASVGTSIVPSEPRLPPADTPDTSSPATTLQVTVSLHDFAMSLAHQDAVAIFRETSDRHGEDIVLRNLEMDQSAERA